MGVAEERISEPEEMLRETCKTKIQREREKKGRIAQQNIQELLDSYKRYNKNTGRRK